MKELNKKIVVVNSISLIRIPATFLSLFLIFSNRPLFALGVCVIGIFLTDIIDGKLARRWNVISDFGKIIDPISDKFSIYALLLGIFYEGLIIANQSSGINNILLGIGKISFIVLFGAEVLVSVLGLFLYWLITRRNKKELKELLGSNIFGKAKTITESISLFFLFLFLKFHSNTLLVFVAILFLVFAAIFAVLSLRKYFLNYIGEKDRIYFWIKKRTKRSDRNYKKRKR